VEPQNLNFGGGTTQTFLSPIVLLAVVIAGVMICVAGRRKALAAFLAGTILIPPDQVLYLGALHFPMLRILALCGLGRITWTKWKKKEPIFSGGVNWIDRLMIVMTIVTLIDGMLLWQVWQQLVFQLGNLVTVFGAYFLLRYLIRDGDDIRQGLQALAVIAGIVAFLMVFEQATGRNLLYSTLGGARANVLGNAISRDDKLRSAGSFAHPILAGTFGGILLPLFVGLWIKNRDNRKFAALGVASCCVIPFAASSSTALFGFMGGIAALCFWPLRRQMRLIRWGIVIVLVSLHLYMKSPVWHLISDIDLTGGSSSYHRYQLVNQCIVHFSDWVLVGTKNYADWGWDMWDLSNQYVAIADTSGLIPLGCFVAIIVLGFRYMGRAHAAFRGDRKSQLFAWALGSSLFANVVAFFGISYFDQTIVAWYALLAMICATAASARKELRAKASLNSDQIVPPDVNHEQEYVSPLAHASRSVGLSISQ